MQQIKQILYIACWYNIYAWISQTFAKSSWNIIK